MNKSYVEEIRLYFYIACSLMVILKKITSQHLSAFSYIYMYKVSKIILVEHFVTIKKLVKTSLRDLSLYT
jgi:hypothetical protein